VNKKYKITIAILLIIVIILTSIAIFLFFINKKTSDSTSDQASDTSSEDESSEINYIVELPHFGIEEDFDTSNDVSSLSVDDLKDLGIKLVRTHGGPFVWDNVENTKGTYDFTLTDNAVATASDANVSIFASLWPYAVWDQENNPECRVSGTIDAVEGRVPEYRCKPNDTISYKNFLKEMVERYDGDDNFGESDITEEIKEKIKKQPVIFWEVDNEVDLQDPDPSPFFVGTIDDYKELLEMTYKTIKEVCPNCYIAISAPARDTEAFYDEILSSNYNEYFDIYNLHGAYNEIEQFTLEESKPVWLSEGGGGHGLDPQAKEEGEPTEEGVSVDMVKTVLENAKLGISSEVMSMVPDKAKLSTKKIEPGKEDEFYYAFLLDGDGNRTKSFEAIQTLTKHLEYFTNIEEVSLDNKDITAYKFTFSDKDPEYVYYINALDVYNERITPPLEGFIVEDLFGNQVDITNNSFEAEIENVYFLKTPFAKLSHIEYQGFKFSYPEDWVAKITDKTERDTDLGETYLFIDREKIVLYPKLYPKIKILVSKGNISEDIIPEEAPPCISGSEEYTTDNFNFTYYTYTCNGDFTHTSFHNYVLYDNEKNSTLHIDIRIHDDDDEFFNISKEFIDRIEYGD